MNALDPNVRKYRAYTKWLQSLPEATEVGTHVANEGRWQEPLFTIDGHKGQFLLGSTGDETPNSVIASLSQGNLLKARVFEPKRQRRNHVD
jgi:hypothetical protein